MSKKILLFIGIVSLFVISNALAADKVWTNGTSDGLWKTTGNWSGGLPTNVDKAKCVLLPGPTIDSTTAAVCQWLVVADTSPGALTMTGGTLNVSGTPDSWSIIGYALTDVGTFTMSSGTVTTSNRFYVGYQGQGTINMNGGTINIGGVFGVGANLDGITTGKGTVYLTGGTINVTSTAATNLLMNSNGLSKIDVTGGTLILAGDKTTLVNGYKNNGWITAYSGSGTLNVVYASGVTTVTATGAATKALNPIPASGALHVDINPTLGWTAGQGAASHNVYFGTTSPGTFQDNQTGTTFNPGTLDFNTVYYWRIDEVNGPNVVTGDVWNFTVTAGKATNPDPASGTANAALDKMLGWTPGFIGASHDVYFGTSQSDVTNASLLLGDLDRNGCVDFNDMEILANNWLLNPAGSDPYAGVNSDAIVDFVDYSLLAQNWMNCTSSIYKGNQAGNDYTPGTLGAGTTYYWRIDEVIGPQTIKGDVWSFSTISGKASNPSPANGASGVATDANLSWTAGAGATSHNVYFGTTNPPPSQGNQTATTFNPGMLNYNTMYYWRIDEVGAGGTITGDLWSFTTTTLTPTDANWTNGSGDHLWRTAANWSGGAVPNSANKAAIRNSAVLGPIIDSATTAVANECVVGDWSSTSDTLTMTGGTLTLGGLNNWLILGYGGSPVMNSGTFNLSGGTVSIPEPCGVMFVGLMGTGTLNMTGGTINVGQTFGIAQQGGTAVGRVNLDGGTITCGQLNMTSGALMDVNAGTLIINGDVRTTINTYISNGWITAYDGAGSVSVDFNNINPGKTTVTGTFAKASAPNPANGAAGVALSQTLSWTAGQGAVSHNVYFGTASPGTFQGNQTGTTFNPGTLEVGTTYYWRIDEVNDANVVTTGTVWSFTTISGKASNPSPANGATGVAINTSLSWSAGYGALSHNVYFGTTNPPPFVTNTTNTSYAPGTLANSTTYYWRIDEVGAGGTITGDVWSFTTVGLVTLNMRKGPYLIYTGNNTQMSVLWQVNATGGCSIAWGTDTSYSMGSAATTEYGSDHQHRYNITGLTPGTKYYYKVTAGSNVLTGSFHAAPASDATDVKFFMYGDTRTNTSINDGVCAMMITKYTSDPCFQTIVLQAGDWVESDDESTETSQWWTWWASGTNQNIYTATKNMAFCGCIGNHESGATVWSKYWAFPFSNQPRYNYSFDYGPVHITVVDQYTTYTNPSTQYTWLVNDLSSSTKPWKILVWHEPAWSAYGSGAHGNNATAQAVFQPLCQTYGVQLVLTGHNHFYSRCAVPLNGSHTIQHICSGNGGAPYYGINTGQPYVVTATANTPGCDYIDIQGNTLTFTSVSSSAIVLDSFMIDRTTW